jgi:hypothetical protein
MIERWSRLVRLLTGPGRAGVAHEVATVVDVAVSIDALIAQEARRLQFHDGCVQLHDFGFGLCEALFERLQLRGQDVADPVGNGL